MLESSQNKEPQQIISAFKNGEYKAILNCYKTVYPDVLSYILKNSGTEAQAQEVIWRVFEKFRQHCLKPDFEIQTHFKAYIMGICRFTWLDQLKAHKKQRKHQIQISSLQRNEDDLNIAEKFAATEDSEHALHIQQTLELTAKAILDLSGLCREIFTLWSTEELSHKEIAAVLAIKPETSRKRLKDCRKKLKKRLVILYGEVLQDEPLMWTFVNG